MDETVGMAAGVVELRPLLGAEGASQMLQLCRAHGSYGQYSHEGHQVAYTPDLPQRFDSALNFVRTGGRFGRRDTTARAIARTNYVRETYAYGDEVRTAGVEMFRDHSRLADAARQIHGRPLIEPAIVYANVLMPGQELATHTDVPEFLGANRTVLPQWLLVVMHHSGLFERWRMPVATAIAYFGEAAGGELHLYPDGPDGEVLAVSTEHDSAVVLDTDSVFHGVDRVKGDDSYLDDCEPGMQLAPHGDRQWRLTRPDGRQVATFDDDEVRFSVSWKAYCFADSDDRQRWMDHREDLTLERILDDLEAEMRRSGALVGGRPAPEDFARLLVAHFVHFPPVSA